MENVNWFKIFKIWMYSLFGFDLLIFAYLMITGRILDELYFYDFVTVLVGIGMVSSAVVAVAEIIYSIVKKEYNRIFIGLGIAVGVFILFVWMLVLALAAWT